MDEVRRVGWTVQGVRSLLTCGRDLIAKVKEASREYQVAFTRHRIVGVFFSCFSAGWTANEELVPSKMLAEPSPARPSGKI